MIHRETKEVLDLQLKRENHLRNATYQKGLSTPLGNSILMLWGIPTGVTGMGRAKPTKVLLLPPCYR